MKKYLAVVIVALGFYLTSCSHAPPLHSAAKTGDLGELNLLLEEGGDVNEEDRYGRTPLMYGARYSNIETVNYLLDKGASVNVVDNEGMTPLMCAENYGTPEMVEAIRQNEEKAEEKKSETETSNTKKALRLEIIRFFLRRPLN